MKELETFDDSHFKLSDIVNSSFNWVNRFPENKVIKKILQSLPERSYANVVAIEEHTDLNTLVLRNRLEICELLKPTIAQLRKQKGLLSCPLNS